LGNFQGIGAFGKFSYNRSFWIFFKESELLGNFQGIGAFRTFSRDRSFWGIFKESQLLEKNFMQPELLGFFFKESELLGNFQGIEAFGEFSGNRSFWEVCKESKLLGEFFKESELLGNFQAIGPFGKFSRNRSFWEIVKESELLEIFQGIGAFGEFSTFRVQFPISQFSLWGLRHPNYKNRSCRPWRFFRGRQLRTYRTVGRGPSPVVRDSSARFRLKSCFEGVNENRRAWCRKMINHRPVHGGAPCTILAIFLRWSASLANAAHS
jgi:hypothetical protein